MANFRFTLSGLLALALSVKRKNDLSIKTQAFDNFIELVLVAGVGFEPTTLAYACMRDALR
jgi:hypothetical protein